MYQIDQKDIVVPLGDLPESSAGAPIPIIVAGEHDVLVSYYLQNLPEDWDFTTIKMVSPDTNDEPTAIVKFSVCYAHMFGPPNDEAFEGHPISSRGLKSYGAFEVLDSSWIRSLERMNAVHYCHRKDDFLAKWRHFVLSFHDTTFECIAERYEFEVKSGSVRSMIPEMAASLR